MDVLEDDYVRVPTPSSFCVQPSERMRKVGVGRSVVFGSSSSSRTIKDRRVARMVGLLASWVAGLRVCDGCIAGDI